VEQIYVTPEKEFEIITRVGDQVILFGDTTAMAGKFKKLEIFYSEALNRRGWNEYKSLNLKFRNQIICKK
jgi:cell division protein FtsQ